MKCTHKQGIKNCENPGTHACITCQPLHLYCSKHGGGHYIETNHKIILIENIDPKILKQQIKSCISNIAQHTNSVISEIRRISLNTINQLKQINKNVNDINQLSLHSYDPKRISFLLKQVNKINQKMNEKPDEITENLLNDSNEKVALTSSLKAENEKLLDTISQQEALIAAHEKKINMFETRIQDMPKNQMSTQVPFKRDPSISLGTDYKEFNQMTLEKKKEYLKENWRFIKLGKNTTQLLLSYDRLVLFHCKFKSDYSNFN